MSPMNKGILLGCSALAGTAFLPASAFAQQGQQAQISAIEEIVVTSRRREENLQSVPLSVAAFSDVMLERRNIRRIEDVADFVPNLALTESERTGHARVVIRGIGGGNPDPSVSFGTGLYIDGQYVADSVGAYDSAFEIERIEVLRGPQGTLFGRNTTGGLVNIITKKPGPDPDAMLQLDYGRFNYKRIKAAGNVVLVPDQLFMRVGANYESDKGYYKNLKDGEGWGDIEARNSKVALRWLPDDNWTVDLTGSYSWQPRHANGGKCKFLGMTKNVQRQESGAPTNDTKFSNACNAVAALPTFEFMEDQRGFANTEVKYLAFQPQWDSNGPVGMFDNLTMTMNLGYRWTGYSYLQPLDFTFANFQARGSNVRYNYAYTGEVLFNGQAMDGKLDLTTGFYSFNQKGGAQGQNCFDLYKSIEGTGQSALCSPTATHTVLTNLPTNVTGAGALPSAAVIYIDNWAYAVFGHAAYNITESLKLNVGGRYSWDHKGTQSIDWTQTRAAEGFINLLSDNTVDVYAEGEDTWKRFTPMASLTYEINDVGALDSGIFYGSISTGFLSGGINTEGGPLVLSVFPSYGPEEVTAYEIGAKTTWADNRFRLNVALFHTDYKDKVEEVPFDNSSGIFGGDNAVQAFTNISKVKIKGIEIESQIAPTDALLIDASFSYLQNRYAGESLTAIPANLQPFVEASFGEEIVINDFTPPWRANISGSYTFDMPNGATLTPRLTATLSGTPRTTSATQAQQRKIDPNTGVQGICYREGYEEYDGRITWENADRNVSVALYGTNLSDIRRFRTCTETIDNAGNITGNGFYSEILEPPFKWGITTMFRF